MPKNAWISFLKVNAGSGKSMKQLSKEYHNSAKGCGLSGGVPSGGVVSGGRTRRKKSRGRGLSGGASKSSKVPKGALASLLQGLNANINVK